MDLMRTINPFVRSTTADQAVVASRSASYALFIGALMALAGAIVMMTSGAEALRIMAQATADEYGLEGRGKMIADLSLAMMFGFALVQALLGVWHWRHPGTILPMIALIVVAWGVIQTLLRLSGVTGGAGSLGMVPLLKLILMLLQILLFAVAVRGGNTLDRIRRAAAAGPAPSAD